MNNHQVKLNFLAPASHFLYKSECLSVVSEQKVRQLLILWKTLFHFRLIRALGIMQMKCDGGDLFAYGCKCDRERREKEPGNPVKAPLVLDASK